MSDAPTAHRDDAAETVFAVYLRCWDLCLDGAPITTHSSDLLPVRTAEGAPAMLKIAHEPEERFGGLLMGWWDGDGAARVLRGDEDAILVERALGPRSLAAMARAGGIEDDEATRIICRTIARLHAPRPKPLPDLIPLTRWFRALAPASAQYGGLLAQADGAARELLVAPEDVGPLHGDVHHDNVLDFGPRGWLAIDPKRLIGERGFDYANIFRDPDFEVAARPGRLERQASIVAEAAGLDRTRLLMWILAFAGLSAVWCVEDGMTTTLDLTVAELAAAELRRTGRSRTAASPLAGSLAPRRS